MTMGVAAVLVAAPVMAQQTAPPADNAAKSQTYIYERTLRSAVELGGQKLAQQASVFVPQIVLAATEQPIVRGVRLIGFGFFFDVQVPNIDQSSVMVWDMVNQSSRVPRNAMGSQGTESPARPVGTVGATSGPVAADPMVTVPAAFSPDRAYSNFVREALIDALLDSSGVLPLGADEKLTVAASGIDQPSSTLYRSGKLMLTIKAADLLELRQGHITRDQAKERIVEERF
jgi:hypothetical protein